MEDSFQVIENYLMVRMPEEIDHHKSVYISKKADDYIMQSGVGNVVFDFEDTKFMDSSGIGLIIGRYKLMARRGGSVAVRSPVRAAKPASKSTSHRAVDCLKSRLNALKKSVWTV